MGKLFGRSDDGGKKDSLLPRRAPIEAPQDKQLQARSARVAEIEAARGAQEAPPARPGLLARCGGCACRSITLLFPVNGCLFMMLALYALSRDRVISEVTISELIATYGDPTKILALLVLGASCTFVTGAMRKIQFGVYLRRIGDESQLWRALNIASTLSLILAYAGFCILAYYDAISHNLMHNVGAFLYFVLSSAFGLLHMAITWKQTQYPLYAKLIFSLVPLASTTSILVYLLSLEEVGVLPDTLYVLEWLTVALNACLVGCAVLLFLHDPVDDELCDFFCCRRGQNGEKGGGKNGTGLQMRKRGKSQKAEGGYSIWDM